MMISMMISMMMSSILFAKVPLQQGSQAKEAHVVHKTKDGSPRFTNALIHSKSTYLRQHAHQPIQWQAWQDSVLKRAENDQKISNCDGFGERTRNASSS